MATLKFNRTNLSNKNYYNYVGDLQFRLPLCFCFDDQGCVALRDISEQNILKKRFLTTQKQSDSEVNHGI